MSNLNSISAYRELFSHHQNGHIYLNHAAISPLPITTSRAVINYLQERTSGSIENFESWMETIAETRKNAARLIDADTPDQITFMGNTSDGISAVAEGFPWEKGDEIILNTMEFPANIQPFRALKHRGVNLVYLPPQNGKITPEMIEKAITPATKMISVSAVQYLNGFKADLERIGKLCKNKGIYFIVDGIQALGAVPINVKTSHIDALATGGHKWLMSPAGTGFLYLSENLAQNIRPAKTGWLSVENPWELSNFEQNWKPVPMHLETGTLNIAGLFGMNESIKMFLDIGLQNIQSKILETSRHAIQLLQQQKKAAIVSAVSDQHRAGIVTFRLSGHPDPGHLVNILKQRNITISSREGLFRISVHFYNTIDEIERALSAIFDL